jgi:hypothetical protein
MNSQVAPTVSLPVRQSPAALGAPLTDTVVPEYQ